MTDDDIQEIKRNLSTERIIKRAASDWKDESSGDKAGRCTHPEHGHTSDSSNAGNLVVFNDGNWYCHSHGTGGDVLDWIAIEMGHATCQSGSVTGDAFVEVLNEAADRAGVELSSKPTPDNYEEAAEMDSLSEEEKASYALDAALDILHERLSTVVGGDTVRRIIKERRPFGDDVLDDLRVGYLDGEGFAELLRNLSKDALKDIGFMRDNGSQHGTGRIIYPYYRNGKPVFWAGRATQESEMDAKYLKPYKESTVFDEPVFEYGTQGSTVGDGVWITEGIQDAIALSEAGGVYAVSPVAKDTSVEQKSQIIAAGQEEGRAIICFDADEGGQGGAVGLATSLMKAGVQTEILTLPEGTDPCDYFFDGGSFSELEPEPAAERIIEVKGDSDPLIRRLLDTAEPNTPRAERLVDSIARVTPIRKSVLREMMEEERQYEEQQGWQEPVAIAKTGGADRKKIFVYADGTEIEMDRIAKRGAAKEFADKYDQHFNFCPTISQKEFVEMYNEWQGNVGIRGVDPFSEEGIALESVMETIQDAPAVPEKDDLAAVSYEYVAHNEGGEIIVQNTLVREWADDLDISLRKMADYLSPIRDGGTRNVRIGGSQTRCWFFDADEIGSRGYSLPNPSAVVEEGDEADDEEEVDTL